ncbi:MAG: hypothetical protein F4024_11605 [Gammaproteobacteria bacterium]|nr:hypothetical protein [Gammaproteobacteria bacterium]
MGNIQKLPISTMGKEVAMPCKLLWVPMLLLGTINSATADSNPQLDEATIAMCRYYATQGKGGQAYLERIESRYLSAFNDAQNVCTLGAEQPNLDFALGLASMATLLRAANFFCASVLLEAEAVETKGAFMDFSLVAITTMDGLYQELQAQLSKASREASNQLEILEKQNP